MNESERSIWEASPTRKKNSEMQKYLDFLQQSKGLSFPSYQDLQYWSVNSPLDFWKSLISYFDIYYEGDLKDPNQNKKFLCYDWFPNLNLNFCQNLLRNYAKSSEENKVALNFYHESGENRKISYQDLLVQVSQLQSYLKNKIGIQKGDIIAAYMPNICETVIAMLATSSLGAIFTSTSCDFGVEGVLDRFQQTEPRILITCHKYSYNNKIFHQQEKILKIKEGLPSLDKVIIVDFFSNEDHFSYDPQEYISWNLIQESASKEELIFTPVPFSHPLYIMYSSGTTGKPKCIVHGTGGTLLQHLKELNLHTNLNSNKKIFFFTTCGWMMWNWLISSLALGAEIVLYEGSPAHPSLANFMHFIDLEKIHIWGTSPKFISGLQKQNLDFPSSFSALETILSTGSPLLPEHYQYIYKTIKNDVHIASISGGTDILSCFMLGNPLLPVYPGEIQCFGLGMDMACFDDEGKEVFNQEGELICKTPFPSMPIYFWNDPNLNLYKKAYFERFPNVWHHGDFVTITERKGVIVHGRSDATLNPGGVRIGTAEIYRQVEQIEGILDSLCIGKNTDNGDMDIYLFIKISQNALSMPELVKNIKERLKSFAGPRYIPKEIYAVTDIPYTRSGKKMELIISKIFNNREISNLQAINNPQCLDEYKIIKKNNE